MNDHKKTLIAYRLQRARETLERTEAFVDYVAQMVSRAT